MPAAFREVFPYAGVDEKTATGKVGIVVPWKGSNIVMLVGGSGLKVASNLTPAVEADEITSPHYHIALANVLHPTKGTDIANTMAMLKTGVYRIFKITGNSVAGLDKVKVEAKKTRTSKPEAELKVLVLRQRLIKISIRPVQVRVDKEHVVTFTDVKFEPQNLLDQMNSIWKPQAEIAFELGRTDPAVIDSLTPKSEGANILNPTMAASFQSEKDCAAHFTAFLVRRAYDGNERVSGVTDSKAGFALIGDDRSDRTLAHEAGHFLGAVDERGKFTGKYGDQGTDTNLLMRDGGAGWKIPFGQVTDFNKGYTKH